MVVDDKNNFITARSYPELLQVVPTIRNSVLTLSHANMESMSVNLAEVGYDVMCLKNTLLNHNIVL